jgi:hypothetical protein
MVVTNLAVPVKANDKSRENYIEIVEHTNITISMEDGVRDVKLVTIRNVFGTCADKMDADRGIDIINLMLKSH